MRVLLLLALVLPAAANAQAGPPWRTTDWSVWCPDPSVIAVPAMCDDENPVAAAAFARDQLRRTSAWLQGLGFFGPHVPLDEREASPRRGTAYAGVIAGDTLRIEGTRVAGYYLHGDPAGLLVVNTHHALTVSGGTDRLGTGAHELFHAVQGSYPFFGSRSASTRWITEGTAHAVEVAYRQRTDGGALFGDGGLTNAFFANRDYGKPLHLPSAFDDLDQSYATAHFWLALGEMLGATERVDYLHDVLLAAGTPDGGLAGLEAIVARTDPAGLYRVFPRFIARYAASSRHYLSARAPMGPISGRDERTELLHVEPNAARFVSLRLAPPPGVTLGVTVTLEDVPGAHLVVGDRVLSEPDPLDPGAERNVFRTQVSQVDTLAIRAVNIEPGAGGSAATFALTVRVEPLEACAPGPMMATLHPDFEWAQRQLARTVVGGLMDRGLVHDAATYQREFETVETAPAPGDLRLSGLVSDGGVGCGDPIGRSPMWAVMTLGQTAQIEAAMTDPARQAEMMARIQEQMATMTEEDVRNAADSSFALAAQVGSMWGADERAGLAFGTAFIGDEIEAIVGPHTVLRVFSPNAFGWQVDWVPGGHNFLRHGGVGGWQANAGAVAAVLLPGTDVQRLRAGDTVPARLAVGDPEGGDDEAMIVYSRWTGRHVPVHDAPTHAFEGEVVTVRSRSLAGTFEVTEVTGAEVRGRLRLTGPAHRLDERHELTRDGDGRVDGDRVEESRETRGPLTVEATVRLPAAVEVQRPGRFIERTARLGERR